jgi:hypothetical protein
VFCSNRGRRGGCGRSFALFLAEVLPRHSVTSSILARLLIALLAGAAIKAAAEAQRAPFALETFYRLVRRLRGRLDVVRTCLHRTQPAPDSRQADTLAQTTEHLLAVFPVAVGGVVAAFQLCFQCPLLG